MKQSVIKITVFWLTLLTLWACSNELPLQQPEGEMVRIGQITTRTSASAWVWADGDRITATATGKSAVFIYSTDHWGVSDNAEFTVENIGADAIALEFGTSALVPDQSGAAGYRIADYLKGSGTLSIITLTGTLEHQQCDLVLTVTKGTGWASDTDFNEAMSDASCLFACANTSGDIKPFRDGSVFRAIFPPANLPTGTDVKIATLIFGSTNDTPQQLRGHTATITYTNNMTADDLKKKRLQLTAMLNRDCSVTITVGINDWDKQNGPSWPGELHHTS